MISCNHSSIAYCSLHICPCFFKTITGEDFGPPPKGKKKKEVPTSATPSTGKKSSNKKGEEDGTEGGKQGIEEIRRVSSSSSIVRNDLLFDQCFRWTIFFACLSTSGSCEQDDRVETNGHRSLSVLL